MSMLSGKNTPLIPALLEWRGTVPVSQQYGDVYFSLHGGLAEAQHVFLQHNDLPQRWRKLGMRTFVIAETGFGTGLNFLAASQAWLATADETARLHYIAVEKHPLQKQDLLKALSSYPELLELLPDFLSHYPPPARAAHRLHLFHGRICLTLCFMDVLEWLQELELAVDAWFLDGFAPARNPDMWSAAVLARIGALSASDGTFSTFTAAGEVRRGLQAAGFEVVKVQGYAGKREMLCGRYTGGTPVKPDKPWFHYRAPGYTGRKAVVIGAGLAGAFTAQALACRHWQVSVLEQAHKPGQGASGNAAAVIYSKFSAHTGLDYRFYQQAYMYAITRYPDLGLSDDTWQACGVLQLAFDAQERERQSLLLQSGIWPTELMQALNPAEADALAGLPLDCAGLFFPQAGWVAPRRLCEHLLHHPAIELRTSTAVASMEHNSSEGWTLFDRQGHILAVADIVILANAGGGAQFPQVDYLSLRAVRGQVSYVPVTAASAALRTVLSFDGYITPALEGRHSLGATFDRDNTDPAPTTADHRRNLQNLEQAAPHVHRALTVADAGRLEGRVAFRTYAGELPVVGPAPDAAFYRREYAGLAKGQLHLPYPCGEYHPGLYLNLAHGARGVTTTPLAAEMIAAYADNEPQPLPEPVRQALHPGRFIVRRLRRGI
ncbi:MAG TPA: bifunctional tRNA (5-methylaminomethyl-2-thiouridine)(34)-methyltransferase MnmD/FAD-dependent 5-carboxymethylaminomethyl-2-thiouridine(34) oxidoreductase MnmC [Gammaproteobacteria bacterium]